MRRTRIVATAAFVIAVSTIGYAGAQEKQPDKAQQMQKRDPPPGDAQTGDKRAERAQSAAPMKEDQGQKPTAEGQK